MCKAECALLGALASSLLAGGTLDFSRSHPPQGSPLEAVLAQLEKFTMIHSHPTSGFRWGGPTGLGLATASTYREPGGQFRYLYLINPDLKMMRYKAIRPLDPGAARNLPRFPRPGKDYMD